MPSLRLVGILLSTLIIGSCSIGQEYRDHYQDQQHRVISTQSPTTVTPSTLSGVTIWVMPDLDHLDSLTQMIDQAQDRVWIEIYTWTERSTLEAVIRAHERGVDVRVVLEGAVFGSPAVNNKTLNSLRAVSVPVVLADHSKFTFTHAKFWIIDDRYFVSTGNWSLTSWKSNREIIVSGTEPLIREELARMHQADLTHRYFVPTHRLGDPESLSTHSPIGLIFSPVSMRPILEQTLRSAKKSIRLYVQSLSDPALIQILREQSQKGVEISICVADKGDIDEINKSRNDFSETTIDWRAIKKPYPHIKYINIDDQKIFIGSTNLTTNALDNNREIGILFSYENFPQELERVGECQMR